MGTRFRGDSWWGMGLKAFAFAGFVVGVAYLLSFVWPRVFDLNALQLLGANLLGVLLAAFFALETERRLADRTKRRQQKDAAAAQRERAWQALGVLRELVSDNKEEVEEIVTALRRSPHRPVYTGTDPQAFDPVLSRIAEMVDDLHIVRQVSTFRRQLQALNRRVKAQLELYLFPELHPQPGLGKSQKGEDIERFRRQIVDRTMDFGKQVSKQADRLLNQIDTTRSNLRETE